MQILQNKNSETPRPNLLEQLLFKYLPYWPLFLLFSLFAIGGAYIYLRYATSIYEAKATLVIKDEKKGYDDSKMVESLNMVDTKKILENELEVLRSRTLMDRVVKNLHLYAPIYEEGKIKSASAYIKSPITVMVANPDSMQEVSAVYLKYDSKSSVVVLNNELRYSLHQWVNTPFGKLKFELNQKYQKPNEPRQLFFSLLQPEKVTQYLLDDLKAAPSNKLSTIVNLYYLDAVPQRAEDILNELIVVYNQAAVNDKNNLALNTLSFVEERLNAVVHELDSIEKEIQQYKTSRGAIDVSTQGKLFLQNVSTNDQRLSDVNMQLAVLNQIEKFVVSKENSASMVPSTLGVSDPVLAELLETLYASELEYEKLKKTVGENNPLLVSVTDQINKIKSNILANIISQRKSLEASKKNLYATNKGYNSMLQSIPQKERQILEISRAQTIKKEIYSFLLQKREESAISYASTVPNTKVVDKAQASFEPVSPDKKSIYALSVFGAWALVVGLITIKEALNRKVMYRQELEALTSVPVIAEIAYEKNKDAIVIEDGKRTLIAEEFRKIRLVLSFLGIGPAHKKILVTSSIPGEGKSFVASNLAVTLAITGKKVVLVDMDLNNPSLNRIFAPDATKGVSDFLKGQCEAEDIVIPSSYNPNLFFVPTGDLPANPAELLSNGQVEDLIAYLNKTFDYVVIDTAPVVPVTDAYILSAFCDATMYVVRHNYTPKFLIKRVDNNNEIHRLTNPAILFNGVHTRGFTKNEYGYGYGYGYVYDYKPNPRKHKKSLV